MKTEPNTKLQERLYSGRRMTLHKSLIKKIYAYPDVLKFLKSGKEKDFQTITIERIEKNDVINHKGFMIKVVFIDD